jgi:peptidoglycan/xylan/chitin deacetylase (PgdA/CDA1 family)
MESKRGFDEPMAAITFDDGYRDFYENAYPVLKRKGVPAALFVVTSTVGTDELHLHDKLYLLLLTRFRQEGWTSSKLSNFLHSLGIWIPQIKAGDAYHATRALLQQLSRGEIARIIRALENDDPIPGEIKEPFYSVTWAMLDEMCRNGICLGSHSKNHILMTNESRQRVLAEAAESRREIEKRLGIQIQHFAYPDGKFDSGAVKSVEAAGYRFAYTICIHRSRAHPRLTVPRRVLWENSCIDAGGNQSRALLNYHIGGMCDLIDPCKDRHAHLGGWEGERC